MKKLVVLIASLMIAGSAFAQVDPDPNSIGVYFDTDAMVYETSAGPYAQIPTYIILTRPDFGAIFGFEVGYDIVGNATILNTALAGPAPLDMGGAGNHIVGTGGALATTNATILATLTVLNMDVAMGPISFTLHGAEPNSVPGSNLPCVLLEGDVILPCGTSSYSEGVPGVNAIINGTGVVATDEASWDEVKSLYR